MRDFTLKIYNQLLEKLLGKGYGFATFGQWAEQKEQILRQAQDARTQSAMHLPLCILRHDVDKLPENSLATAKIENELGIRGTYYFRIVPDSFDEQIIREIATLGHEIGYHYEEVDFAWREINGQWSMFDGQLKRKIKEVSREIKSQMSNVKSKEILRQAQNDNEAMITLAYDMFKKNLERIRKVAPVSTICMHGSPLSPYDNKMIWTKYDYRELGLIGEPYFDIDWNEFGYLTDTGRRWNGSDVSVRDKVVNKNVQLTIRHGGQVNNAQSASADRLKRTQDIIYAIEQNKLPDKVMITVHPQRWTDSYFAWGKELVLQNVKNVVKGLIVKRQK